MFCFCLVQQTKLPARAHDALCTMLYHICLIFVLYFCYCLLFWLISDGWLRTQWIWCDILLRLWLSSVWACLAAVVSVSRHHRVSTVTALVESWTDWMEFCLSCSQCSPACQLSYQYVLQYKHKSNDSSGQQPTTAAFTRLVHSATSPLKAVVVM